MSRMPPVLVALLGAATLVAGCGDDGEPDAADTTTTSAVVVDDTTTTTTEVDPFTVPDEITVEYVEAVLTELERINGDALRLAMAEGMSTEVTALLETVLVGQVLEDRANAVLDASAEPLDIEPGDIGVEVVGIETIAEGCVVADVTEDYSGVGPAGVAELDVRVAVIRSSANPTGWVYAARDIGRDEEGASLCGD